MKKALFFTIACTVSTALQAPHLLHEFETVKADAARIASETEAKIKKDWDTVIDLLEKALQHAKMLQRANANINQHDQAAKEIKEHLEKQITGQTKGKTKATLTNYANTAHNANTMIEQHLQRASHLSKNLDAHLEKSITTAKEQHKKTVTAHDSAQKAIAQADAQSHMPEHKKYKKESASQ